MHPGSYTYGTDRLSLLPKLELCIYTLTVKGSEAYSGFGEVEAESAAELIGREAAGDERDKQGGRVPFGSGVVLHDDGIGEEVAGGAQPYLEVRKEDAYHVLVAPYVKDFLRVGTLEVALADESVKVLAGFVEDGARHLFLEVEGESLEAAGFGAIGLHALFGGVLFEESGEGLGGERKRAEGEQKAKKAHAQRPYPRPLSDGRGE